LDSNGKPPSGILQGTLTDFGSFDECLQLNTESLAFSERFETQYCLMDINANFNGTIPTDATPPPNIETDGIIWDPILRLFWSRNNLLSFRYGLCVPSTCTQQELMELGNFLAEPMGLSVNVHYCQKEKTFMVDKTQTLILASFASLLLLIIVGTVTEVSIIYRKNEKFLADKSIADFLVSFSIYRNNKRFLSAAKKLQGSPLQHLNGVRCLSLCWIIMGHTYFYTDFVHYHHYRRLQHIQNVDDDLTFMPIANFTLSVNTFFFISGLLVVYSNWKKLTASEGRIGLLKFFFHRIWRIWPPYFVVISLVLILPLLGSGPLWPQSVENTARVCRENWWANILFVNNFQTPNELCLLHTWFLAVTMQFYAISAFLLMLLYRFPKLCIFILIAFITMSGIAVYMYAIVNNLRIPTVIADEVFVDERNIVLTLYIMPYNHLGSYLLGIGFGYFLVKHKNARIPKHVQTLAWLASAFIMLFVIFAPYKAFRGFLPTVHHSALYLATHRTLWALAIGWLVFACSTKRGGIINKFLSWSAFGPLSSLTFLAYLIHPLLMVIHTGSIRERVYFGHYELLNIFLARTMMSFGLAYILFVLVELPFSSIEKYIFPQYSKSLKCTQKTTNAPPILPIITCNLSNQVKFKDQLLCLIEYIKKQVIFEPNAGVNSCNETRIEDKTKINDGYYVFISQQ
ncbi:nose resistant to fluoxetine protein 6-like isoform X1, partial [Dinothrombium tinctorium]